MKKEIIEQLIKQSNFKWDKYSYAYAIGFISPYSFVSLYYGSYKKSEIIESFYSYATDPQNEEKVKRLFKIN